jgi:hypothetical protein
VVLEVSTNAGEGASNRSRKKKKKNKQWNGDLLVAAVERKGKKGPTRGASNHFMKLLKDHA